MKFQNFSISDITDYAGSVTLDGKIDAIFKHDDGILIVDWKTDKDVKSEHKQQVEFYKKVYAKLTNTPEDDISTCVIYISLRDSIDTGKLATQLDFVKRGNPFETFDNHLKKILTWKEEPQKFIDELLNVDKDEPLLDSIKSNLVPT